MDFNDYQPDTQNRIRLPWKTITIVGFSIILAVVIVVIGVRIYTSSHQAEMLSDLVGIQNDDVSIADEAVLHGSTDICEFIQDNIAFDNCIWEVARTIQDPNACELIKDLNNRLHCSDGVYELLALENKTQNYCESIQDVSRKSRCISYVLGPITSENCEIRDPDRCSDYALWETALEKLDDSYCGQIIDEEFLLSCFDSVEERIVADEQEEEEGVSVNPDPDEDGLTNDEETQYGTDPLNPDTDGDGYSDGKEVGAGYNPLGSGKIE